MVVRCSCAQAWRCRSKVEGRRLKVKGSIQPSTFNLQPLTLGAGEDTPRGDGATVLLVLMEEVNDALLAQFAHAIGVGAMFEQEAKGVTFERLGLDDGDRARQIGMSATEALEVEHRAGPDAVELAQQVEARGLEAAGGLVGEEDVLMQLGGGSIGEGGRDALALLEQVLDGPQVERVILAQAQHQLLPFEFDLIGVEEALEQLGLRAFGEVGGEVLEDVAAPGFVVDAGRLMADDE